MNTSLISTEQTKNFSTILENEAVEKQKQTSSKWISNSKCELRIEGAKRIFFWNSFENSFGFGFLCRFCRCAGVGKEKFDLITGGGIGDKMDH